MGMSGHFFDLKRIHHPKKIPGYATEKKTTTKNSLWDDLSVIIIFSMNRVYSRESYLEYYFVKIAIY